MRDGCPAVGERWWVDVNVDLRPYYGVAMAAGSWELWVRVGDLHGLGVSEWCMRQWTSLVIGAGS